MLSNASALNTNGMMTGAQSFGVFPESSSHVSSDSNQQPSDSMQQDSAVEKEKEASALFVTDIEEKPKKQDSQYEKICLIETPTFCLLDIPKTCVADDDPHIDKIKEKNEKYLEVSVFFLLFIFKQYLPRHKIQSST